MCRDEQVIFLAQLDFLHNPHAVGGKQQPVCPAGYAQSDCPLFIFRAQRLFRQIGRLALRARALPGFMRRRALPHAPGGKGCGRKIALVQAEFHHLPDACANRVHARFLIRQSDHASSSAPRTPIPCMTRHSVGG